MAGIVVANMANMTNRAKPVRGQGYLSLLAMAAVMAGCSGAGLTTTHDASVPGDAAPGTCSYGGNTYQAGASFKDPFSCNTCHCGADGFVGCTLIYCPSDAASAGDWPPPVCAYDGESYQVGASFPSSDGCNTCECSLTGVECTMRLCIPDAGPDARTDSSTFCFSTSGMLSVGQSVSDGCNTCQCMSTGILACTSRACPPDAGTTPDTKAAPDTKMSPDTMPAADAGATLDAPTSCDLPARLTFGSIGGMVLYQDEYALDPKAGLSATRTYYGRADIDGAAVRTCSPALPVCGATGAISVADIVSDLAAADVQASFQKGATPLYGRDERPVDGTVFSITYGDQGTILVGYACPTSSSSCTPIPPGVQRLADDLRSLASAAIASSPECKNL
jgi:hypothetical protein